MVFITLGKNMREAEKTLRAMRKSQEGKLVKIANTDKQIIQETVGDTLRFIDYTNSLTNFFLNGNRRFGEAIPENIFETYDAIFSIHQKYPYVKKFRNAVSVYKPLIEKYRKKS